MATPRIRFRDSGGTLRTATQIRARDSGGTLRTITRIRVRDSGNALRVVYDTAGTSTFTVTVTPPAIGGHSMGTGTVATGNVTASASGGTAPYSYAWTLILYDHGTTAPTATGAASATTGFVQTNVGPAEFYTATFRVTATDSASSANTATFDVDVSFLDTT